MDIALNGHYGYRRLIASSVPCIMMMLVGALGLMVGTGGSALVSKTMGEGDGDRAKAIFSMLVLSYRKRYGY